MDERILATIGSTDNRLNNDSSSSISPYTDTHDGDGGRGETGRGGVGEVDGERSVTDVEEGEVVEGGVWCSCARRELS